MRKTVVAVVAAAALLVTACDATEAKQYASQLTGGSPDHGKRAIKKYGCGTCHTIPGVRGANASVGPSLAGVADRQYLAGKLPNTPENLIRWIRHPQRMNPGTVMPEMGVTDRDARDIAAYLYTLQ